MAKRFEDAGVHGVELNMCCPNMSFNVAGDRPRHRRPRDRREPRPAGGHGREDRRGDKEGITIPLFVKITPEGGQQAQVAKKCLEAGADGVGTNANRLAVPPFDIENPEAPIYHLQDEPSMSCFCGPWLKPLALRDVFEMRKLIGPDAVIFGSGGCRNWKDAVEFFMFGADIVQICTETLVSGFGFMPDLLRDLKDYLARHGYEHPRDIRDKMVPRMTSATELTIFPGHAHAQGLQPRRAVQGRLPQSRPRAGIRHGRRQGQLRGGLPPHNVARPAPVGLRLRLQPRLRGRVHARRSRRAHPHPRHQALRPREGRKAKAGSPYTRPAARSATRRSPSSAAAPRGSRRRLTSRARVTT